MEYVKKETFGERVFRLRTELGLSQSQLAKKIGASHGSIQNYEANSLPKGEFAIKLAEVFECSIDWLLTGKDLINKTVTPGSDHQNTKSEKKDIIVIEHSDLVKEFQDQARAKKINHNLLKIEKNSRQAFRDIDNYIEGIANGLDYAFKEQDDFDELNDPKKTSDKQTHGNGTEGK